MANNRSNNVKINNQIQIKLEKEQKVEPKRLNTPFSDLTNLNLDFKFEPCNKHDREGEECKTAAAVDIQFENQFKNKTQLFSLSRSELENKENEEHEQIDEEDKKVEEIVRVILFDLNHHIII
jgi:hypothetical protein